MFTQKYGANALGPSRRAFISCFFLEDLSKWHPDRDESKLLLTYQYINF